MSQPGFHHALKIGYQLHWYTIDQVLGQGGFGITYLAHDNNLDQRVAIKEFLPTEFAIRGEDDFVSPLTGEKNEVYQWALDRFLVEARTLAKFDHPNIVRVLAVFEANNAAYIVMRYEVGETLEHQFKTRGTLSESELLNILLPIIDGLELVHKEGFIHRDIKPANIFIREDHSPVLIDFGAARQAIGEHTHNLTAMVSTGYSAIEQYYSKAEDQGAWTDVYGLASTAYYGLTGNHPVDAMTRSKDILSGKPDPYVSAVQAGQGHFTTAFLNAIDQGMQFMPEDRPQNLATWKKYFVHTEIPGEQPTQFISEQQPAGRSQPLQHDDENPKSEELVSEIQPQSDVHPGKKKQPILNRSFQRMIWGIVILSILVITLFVLNDKQTQLTPEEVVVQPTLKTIEPEITEQISAVVEKTSPPSLAVLPFSNFSNLPEQDYFVDGMTEDLITDLSKISGLEVIARTSVFQYKGVAKDVREIAQQLGARYLVEGSVRRVNDQVRINAQLIDAETGNHLWADRYDGNMDNVFQLQDQIIGKIAEALRITLTKSESETLGRTLTSDVEAYEFFLRGREKFFQLSKENNPEAREYFKKAIQHDSDFADAYAMQGWTHIFDYLNGWSNSPDASLDQALALANKALALDPELPLAYFVSGLAYRDKGDWDRALQSLEKAIDLDPNYANAHVLLSSMLYFAGRPEEGLERMQKAMRLEPHHPYNYLFHLGQAYFILKQYEEAIETFQEAIERNSSAERVRVWLAASLAQGNQQEEAEWEVDQVLIENPEFSLERFMKAFPFRDQADRDHLINSLQKAGFE
ncbi:MAG: tetratricopeptide repeat protein [Gammaproteobacteria bacterium]|nr:MAG: tetratricopeptide repeat protein [Gammaproteobacteria bacterium]